MLNDEFLNESLDMWWTHIKHIENTHRKQSATKCAWNRPFERLSKGDLFTYNQILAHLIEFFIVKDQEFYEREPEKWK